MFFLFVKCYESTDPLKTVSNISIFVHFSESGPDSDVAGATT